MLAKQHAMEIVPHAIIENDIAPTFVYTEMNTTYQGKGHVVVKFTDSYSPGKKECLQRYCGGEHFLRCVCIRLYYRPKSLSR